MKKLYIIAGPNGAGKTTASYTILPEIFQCDEYVNADEIAKGLSPFNPDKVGLKAGRIMLERIQELLANEESFAFETTLSTRSYTGLIKRICIHINIYNRPGREGREMTTVAGRGEKLQLYYYSPHQRPILHKTA